MSEMIVFCYNFQSSTVREMGVHDIHFSGGRGRGLLTNISHQIFLFDFPGLRVHRKSIKTGSLDRCFSSKLRLILVTLRVESIVMTA